jgi:hypothetical protein
MSAELDPKRLELLHEIVPSVSQAAFLLNPNLTPGLQKLFAGAEAAARSLGIALRRVDAATPADLRATFAAIEEASSQALLVQNDPMLTGTEFSRILTVEQIELILLAAVDVERLQLAQNCRQIFLDRGTQPVPPRWRAALAGRARISPLAASPSPSGRWRAGRRMHLRRWQRLAGRLGSTFRADRPQRWFDLRSSLDQRSTVRMRDERRNGRVRRSREALG